MLTLVPTPIGNLDDITFRAIEVLSSCDCILCEDTRTSLPLLNKYGIKKPLQSYHAHNEAHMVPKICAEIRKGKYFALISDAGTPGISDPGERLIAALQHEHLPVTALPGPCAAITALSLSGFPSAVFQFMGFAPRGKKERIDWMRSLLPYPGTTILYESPQRILGLLRFFEEWIPDRSIGIARELTKKFEEFLSGTPAELLTHFSQAPPRGECVILVPSDPSWQRHEWESLSSEEHVAWIESVFHATRTEAIRIAATMRGVPKRDVYNRILKKK